jgi:hypothetical protein
MDLLNVFGLGAGGGVGDAFFTIDLRGESRLELVDDEDALGGGAAAG